MRKSVFVALSVLLLMFLCQSLLLAANPTVTITAVTKSPTTTDTVAFQVKFSEKVTGFGDSDKDVTLGGPAAPQKATVTGSGDTYTVTVTVLTNRGDVIISIPADAAVNAGGEGNLASDPSPAVTFNTNRAVVTVAPTNATFMYSDNIVFVVTFDRDISGPLQPSGVTVTSEGSVSKVIDIQDNRNSMLPSFYVVCSPPGNDSYVRLTVNAGAVTSWDYATFGFIPSLPSSKSEIFYFMPPRITDFSAATSMTNKLPIRYSVKWSEAVQGFNDKKISDVVSLSGSTADVTGASIHISNAPGPELTAYYVDVDGVKGAGNVALSILGGWVYDYSGNRNVGSLPVTVFYDPVPPTVVVTPVSASPTQTAPIVFSAKFSKPITGLSAAGVTIGGTAGGTKTATVAAVNPVNNYSDTWNISVSGMTTPGTVTAGVKAGVATDGPGNQNVASASPDASIQWESAKPKVTSVVLADKQANPSNVGPINFVVTFDRPVKNDPAVSGIHAYFDSKDPQFGRADLTVVPTAVNAQNGFSDKWTVAVSGMPNRAGTVKIAVLADAFTDGLGQGNTASLDPAAQCTYDVDPPVATVNQVNSIQMNGDYTNLPPQFDITFNEPIDTSKVPFITTSGQWVDLANVPQIAVSGTAIGAVKCQIVDLFGVVPSATEPNRFFRATIQFDRSKDMTGTVILSVPAGAAKDLAGNPNLVSTAGSVPYNDNLVNYEAAPRFSVVSALRTPTMLPPPNGPWTNQSPVRFIVTFTRPVTLAPDYANHVMFNQGSGARPQRLLVEQAPPYDDTTWVFSLSGMTLTSGTVSLTILDGIANDEGVFANPAHRMTDKDGNEINYYDGDFL